MKLTSDSLFNLLFRKHARTPQRLWIHAGMHKTGTTYMQRLFAANQILLQMKGIWYPTQGRVVRGGTYPGHHYYAAAVRQTEKRPEVPDEIREDFRVIPKKTRDVVLSSENFCTMKAEHLKTLLNCIPFGQAKYVLYVRAFAPHIISCWQETVKHGNETGFDEFLSTFFEDPDEGDFPYGGFIAVNPVRVIQRAGEVMGRENVELVNFDRVLAEGEDLFGHFLSRFLDAKLEIPSLLGTGLNQSLPIQTTEALRLLNYFNREMKRLQRVQAAHNALNYFSKHPERGLLAAMDRHLKEQGAPVEIPLWHEKILRMQEQLRDHSGGDEFPDYLKPRAFDCGGNLDRMNGDPDLMHEVKHTRRELGLE